MAKEVGADRALVASDEAPAGLHPTGFDHGDGLTIDGVPMADRIWLIAEEHGEVVWANEPDPAGETAEAVEYVRADIYHDLLNTALAANASTFLDAMAR